MHFGALSIAAVVALTACRGEPRPSADSMAVESFAVAPQPGPDSPVARLAVDGEGLRAFIVASGAARPIAFGRPRTEVIAAVSPLMGGEAPVTTANDECRLSAAAWPAAGLTLSFSSATGVERFAGWFLAPVRPEARAPRLTTASGIGLGSTRAELESAYAASVQRSTLGVEFTAGGLAGLLASDRPDARITNLWAGEVCIAR